MIISAADNGGSVVLTPGSSISTNGNITISGAASVSSSGATINLGSQNSLFIQGGAISIGNINGGSQTTLWSSNALYLNGSINTPGANSYLYGASFIASAGVSISAKQASIANSTGGPVTIAAGDGSSASGFVVSANLLNHTHANVVQIGNGNAAPISVQGIVDLTPAQIGQLFAYSSGSYDSSGASLLLGTNTNLYVNAGSIFTGTVTGGSSLYFSAKDLLDVNGKLSSSTVILEGHPVVFEPISFTQIGGPNSRTQLRLSSVQNADIWYGESARVGLTNSHITLIGGEIIVRAIRDSIILVNSGKIICKKGSIIRIWQDSGNTTVQVLHDIHQGSVMVSVEGSQIQVPVGQEVAILGSKSDPSDVGILDYHGRRRGKSQLIGSRSVFACDFSFVSLVDCSHLLAEVMAQEHDARRSILHTQACVSMVSAKHGQYSNDTFALSRNGQH